MEHHHQQQPQPPQLHRAVVDAIPRLEDPKYLEERHKIYVSCYNAPMDRRSLQHLFDFLDYHRDSHHEVEITELCFSGIELVFDPSPDGGLNVLKRRFCKK
jgi:hypothetical protein